MFVIRHIVGRTLQVYDPDASNMVDNNPKEVLEYDISREAKILLNGVEAKIAELQPGDLVNIDNPSKEGFRAVEVLRDREGPSPGTVDYAQPRVLQLEQDGATHPVQGTQENTGFGNREQPKMSHTPGVPKTPTNTGETTTGEWLKSHRSGSPESQTKLVTGHPKSHTAPTASDDSGDGVHSMPTGDAEGGEPTSAAELKKDAPSSKITQPNKGNPPHDKSGKK